MDDHVRKGNGGKFGHYNVSHHLPNEQAFAAMLIRWASVSGNIRVVEFTGSWNSPWAWR